jgi:hypothetical protein
VTYPPAPAPLARPAAWLPDPLDDGLIRYWDGTRWTFHTALRPVPVAVVAEPRAHVPPPAQPALRPDIAQALQRVRGLLVGSMKEVNQLAGYLRPEERVLALTGAQGEGQGVLACTNQRILFLFVGLVRRQFLQADWNQTKAVIYNRHTKHFAVYTIRPTKRAVPAMAVRVNNVTDAHAVVDSAVDASAAPRLDIV